MKVESTESYDLVTFGLQSKSTKIAGFDLDHCMIVTRSKKTFPIDADDWTFKYNNIKSKFHDLITKGYRIVVITNQLGVSKGKTNKSDIRKKIESISTQLEVDITWIASYQDDLYRKPRTKAFELVQGRSDSFYCGDACGRSKDFSDTDLKFARNLQIKFYSDKQFFTGADDSSEFSLPTGLPFDLEFDINSIARKGNDREVVVLIGPPASGKSTLCDLYFRGYVIINQDTLKTVAKCKQIALQTIKNTKSNIVIDSTNRNKKTRKVWVDICESYKMNIRYIFIDIPKELSLHINTYRMLTENKKIPKIAIHSYYKNLELPYGEIDNIQTIPFVMNRDVADSKLFKSYLL